jgi:transcriptional regulator with AAA-type ATPase domain
LFGRTHSENVSLKLDNAATILLEHAEFESNDLLEHAEQWCHQPNKDAMLIVGTSCEKTAQAWISLCEAPCIRLPPLRSRLGDIVSLIQLFTHSLEKKLLRREIDVSPELVESILLLDWPGNLRQFKSAVIEAVTGDLDTYEDILPTLEGIVPEQTNLSKKQRQTLQAMLWNKDHWERNARSGNFVPAPLACRVAFEKAQGNVRIAAAMLGTSVHQLRSTLGARILGPA